MADARACRRRFFARTALVLLTAAVLVLWCAHTARAEADSAYYFDGEGTYYFINEQSGISLACNSGSDTVTAVSGRLSDKTACTRFFVRSCGAGLYVILPDIGAERYISVYDYGNSLRLIKPFGAIPAEAKWRIIPEEGGIRFVNALTGEYLAAFGLSVKAKTASDISESDTGESALWIAVKTVVYGTGEGAAVRELSVAERSVERQMTKSAKTPLCEMLGFSWGPLTRAEDFAITVDKPEVLAVDNSGTVFVRATGDGTVTARHRITGQVLTAHITVCNTGIILVPGYMGSELVNKKGEKIWSESLLAELTDSLSLSALSRFNSLSSPSSGDGISAVNNFFGALDMYRDLYRTLLRTFGTDAAVEFYAYDWRRSSEDSGKALARYIRNQGYDQVILVGHSFGGLVCAQALAADETLAERVVLACMVSVPVNGSASIAEAWANDRFGNVLGLGSFSSTENAVIRRIVGTLPSLYELLPSAYGVETLHTVEGCTSYESFLSACKDACGSFDLSLARSAGNAMKKIYKDGVCVLDTVPVVWYGGSGKETAEAAKISGGKLAFSFGNEGDGVVSLAESVAGTAAKKEDATAVNAWHLWIADDAGIITDITARIRRCLSGE